MIDTLKIGAVKYTVKERDDLHTTSDDGRKLALHGHIVWASAEIRIASDQTDDMKVCTLWHEALHGILQNAGQDDHPEALIIALGYGIVALLRENPQLAELTIHGQ
jgi:hypothetical protein